MKQHIVIIGAGKIGRGFVADIFHNAGYSITFVDADRQLVHSLNDAGEYPLISIPPSGEKRETKIDKFTALHSGEEREAVISALQDAPLVAVAVFTEAFPAVTELVAEAITRRAGRTGQSAPEGAGAFNIIVCANIADPAGQFETELLKRLPKKAAAYCKERVGIVGSIVLRIGIQPSDEVLKNNPLTVVTNGFPHLYVDRRAFKVGTSAESGAVDQDGLPEGTSTTFHDALPQIDGLVYSDDLERDELRKIYTYNMIHALFAYLGNVKGYSSVVQCLEDDEIMRLGREALNEAGEALQAEFGLEDEETERWNREVLAHMTNPALEDTLERIGRDPARKITRDERLTGAALLARQHGIYPYALSKAIAAAFLFKPLNSEMGTLRKEDIKTYTGLDREAGLIQTILEQNQKIGEGTFFDADWNKLALIKNAYSSGFAKEQYYKGCAQCLLAAMFDCTGRKDETLFQAAGGLSGGIGLCGDGSCGGYTGGSLFLSSIKGRRLEYFDNDKDAQRKAYELVGKLHDRFIETYGSVTCKDIHEVIFGRSYILRDKNVRPAFEEAGAHADKCTTVVAYASAWTVELLMEAGLLIPLQST